MFREEDREWLKNLKVDDVVIVRYSYLRNVSYRKHKIDKITPKGYLKIGETLFNPETGYSRGEGCYLLLNPENEDNKAEFKKYSEQKYIRNVMRRMYVTESLTLEQAKKIDEILSEEIEK